MTGRGAKLALAALAAFVLGAGTAAAAPEGPRLAVQRLDLGSGSSALFTVDPAGGAEAVVREASGRGGSVDLFSAPTWSPDGTRLAVTSERRRRHGRGANAIVTSIELVGVDGGAVTLVPGSRNAMDPVFSPDGSQLAYAKLRQRYGRDKHGVYGRVYSSASIWLVDLTSGESRRLTPWRNRLAQVPSSFSPDGSRLAFTRFVGVKSPEALSMSFDGSAPWVLARDASEPVYSPDGSRIAFLRGAVKTRHAHGSLVTARLTDLYTVRTGGGELRRLTRTAATAELDPSWDPSSQRLSYTALRPFRSELSALGLGDQIREVNADGTCSTKVLSSPRIAFFGAAWQPGPGRAAGPISC